MKLPDVWRCNICGAFVSRFEFHDCKPVPIAKYEEAQTEIERLRARLAEEIKWGHRKCVDGNCLSSGTDCPAQNGVEL